MAGSGTGDTRTGISYTRKRGYEDENESYTDTPAEKQKTLSKEQQEANKNAVKLQNALNMLAAIIKEFSLLDGITRMRIDMASALCNEIPDETSMRRVTALDLLKRPFKGLSDNMLSRLDPGKLKLITVLPPCVGH